MEVFLDRKKSDAFWVSKIGGEMILLFSLIGCQAEYLDRQFHLYTSSEDPNFKLQPYLDHMYDPMYNGFDGDLICQLEQWNTREKDGTLVESNLWEKEDHTDYEIFFVSDVEGIVAKDLHLSTFVLDPLFWKDLSFGEHNISFLAFEEDNDDALCMAKLNVWSGSLN